MSSRAFPRAVNQGPIKGGEGEALSCAFRCISAKMADDSLDESGKTLEPKYLTKQTLFPVIGASKSKGSGSLLFPCSPFKVDERAAGIGKGKGKFFPLHHDLF